MRILIIIKIIALTHNRRVFELAFLWNRASIATTKVANVISGEKLFRVFNSDKKKLEKACLLLKNSCYVDNKIPSFKLIFDEY